MQNHCSALARTLFTHLKTGELAQIGFSGEDSVFLRFNQAKVRQVGQVQHTTAQLALRLGKRQAQAEITLSGVAATDQALLDSVLLRLRETLPFCSEDPFLDEPPPAAEKTVSEKADLPDASYVFDQLSKHTPKGELVGFLATGTISRGLFHSNGTRHWYEKPALNCDWSIYQRADRAVKAGFAGTKWDESAFAQKCRATAEQFELLSLPPVQLKPGPQRVYLAPSALVEIFELIGGGFGQEAIATKQTPLLRLLDKTTQLSPALTLRENTAQGVAPHFNEAGYVKPDCVTLIEKGHLVGALVSPRSAKEYKLESNGAGPSESLESLDVAPGALPQAHVLSHLQDGLYINNLWYLNYSARSTGKITGMTRFGAFQVSGGQFKGPVNVMRFDDTIFNILGTQLDALTQERETIISASTYERRSTASWCLPGMIVSALQLTL